MGALAFGLGQKCQHGEALQVHSAPQRVPGAPGDVVDLRPSKMRVSACRNTRTMRGRVSVFSKGHRPRPGPAVPPRHQRGQVLALRSTHMPQTGPQAQGAVKGVMSPGRRAWGPVPVFSTVKAVQSPSRSAPAGPERKGKGYWTRVASFSRSFSPASRACSSSVNSCPPAKPCWHFIGGAVHVDFASRRRPQMGNTADCAAQ